MFFNDAPYFCTSQVIITPPVLLSKMSSKFDQWYQQKHNGRKLTWQYNQGDCDITSHCFDTRYFIKAATQVAIILHLYNSQTSYTSSEVTKLTNIEQAEAERILTSLCADKQKLLTHNNGIFSINDAFSSDKTRISISLLKKASIQERAREDDEVLAVDTIDRTHVQLFFVILLIFLCIFVYTRCVF